MLSKLVYASRATRHFSETALVELLGKARLNNARQGITGLLLYNSQSFLQVLEGEEASLAKLYEAISRDHRHTELRLLSQAPLNERCYAEWSMGFDHVDDERLVRILPGYRPATRYPLASPPLISSAQVAETVLELYRRHNS